MKSLVRVGVLLAPLLFMSAVCVTDVRQKGDTGPWVGEVTNYGSDTLSYGDVNSSVLDAGGNTVTYVQSQTCPTVLLPGASAAFELFIQPGTLAPSYVLNPPALPLRLADGPLVNLSPIPPDQLQYARTQDGLATRVIRTDPTHRFALIEVRNIGPFSYQQLAVCVTIRGSRSALAAVGTALVTPDTLRQGEARTIPVFFNAMPEGDIQVFAEGMRFAGSILTIDPTTAVSISTRAIVNRADGPHLEIVGEIANTTGQDLSSFGLTAHLDDAWSERINGAVLGCDGSMGRGDRTPFMISIPVESTRLNRRLSVEGISAYEGGLYKLPVSSVLLGSVSKQPDGPDVRTVTATLTNDTSAWIEVTGVCFGVRDDRGTLVGSGYMAPDYPARFIAPGATLRVRGQAEQLRTSHSADVIAYGQPMLQPPPTPVAIPAP
jgi:hypothetical protein